MNNSRALFVAIVAGMMIGAGARGELVQDGGFEGFEPDSHVGPGVLGAWAFEGIIAVDHEVAHGGLQSLSLLPQAVIRQVIPTLPGAVYELTFWNAYFGARPPMDSVFVSLDGVGVGISFAAGDNAWAGHWHTFTAAGSTTLLGLGAFETMQVDDIQVRLVPEPGGIMAAGILGVGLLARRRGRRGRATVRG